MTNIDMVNCRSCGESNRAAAKYCHYCGAQLVARDGSAISVEEKGNHTSLAGRYNSVDEQSSPTGALGETAHTTVRSALFSEAKASEAVATPSPTSPADSYVLPSPSTAYPSLPQAGGGYYVAPPPGQYGGPYGHPYNASGDATLGRRAAAYFIFWGGLLLADTLNSNVPWLSSWSYSGQAGQRGLGLNAVAGPRLTAELLFLIGPLLATLLLPTTVGRRVVSSFCLVAACATEYITTFSVAKDSWIGLPLLMTLGLSGWLVARERPIWSYIYLLPAFGWGVLRWGPFTPGRWFQNVQFSHRWPVTFDFFWNDSISYIPLLFMALLASIRGVRPAAPAPAAWYLSTIGLQVAAVITVVVLAVTTYLPPEYRNTSSAQSGYVDPDSHEGNSGVITAAPITSAQAATTASGLLDEMRSGATFYSCDGSVSRVGINTYTIGQVSPDTNGYYQVQATVQLNGSQEVVNYVLAVRDQPACVQSMTQTGSSPQVATPAPASAEIPPGVPNVPSSGDPIPIDQNPPTMVSSSTAISYRNADQVPSSRAEILDFEPAGLSPDEQSAVSDVLGFWTNVNLQQLQSAWNLSTDSTIGSMATPAFQRGYATSHIYQLAFGQPKDLTANLIALPARFVSRQDPAAQGNPDGVTGCTFWPQYVFLVARVNGQWLTDVAGKFMSDPSVTPLKRYGGTTWSLNPVSQRTAC